VLPTKAQFHNLSNACVNEDWATELSRFEDGLHVSRTLVPRDVWSSSPVRTLNATSKPVSLHAGKVISELQQVEVLDKSAQCYSRSVHDAEVEAEKVPELVQKLLDDVDDSVPEGTSSELKAILMDHLDVFILESMTLVKLILLCITLIRKMRKRSDIKVQTFETFPTSSRGGYFRPCE